jgi:hypothetical protein
MVLAEPDRFVVLHGVFELGEDIFVSKRLAVRIDVRVPPVTWNSVAISLTSSGTTSVCVSPGGSNA